MQTEKLTAAGLNTRHDERIRSTRLPVGRRIVAIVEVRTCGRVFMFRDSRLCPRRTAAPATLISWHCSCSGCGSDVMLCDRVSLLTNSTAACRARSSGDVGLTPLPAVTMIVRSAADAIRWEVTAIRIRRRSAQRVAQASERRANPRCDTVAL